MICGKADDVKLNGISRGEHAACLQTLISKLGLGSNLYTEPLLPIPHLSWIDQYAAEERKCTELVVEGQGRQGGVDSVRARRWS